MDITAENEEDTDILHSMLGVAPKVEPPSIDATQVQAPTQPMSSLFEENQASSFSLFNFMPETKNEAAPAEEAETQEEDKKK